MNKITILMAVFIAVPLAAMAQFNSSEGRGVPVDKVADALKAPDETAVVLTGNIVERIRSETYRFSDGTGEIRLDIGEEIWAGVAAGPQTQVRIVGETDRGLGGVDIWVHSVETVGSADDAD
jgi:uncharacterized protein (TIGR00156 family)